MASAMVMARFVPCSHLEVIVDGVCHGDGQPWPDELPLPVEVVYSHLSQPLLSEQTLNCIINFSDLSVQDK
jgi:hypothetical protein